jgi:hypothetical protein
MNLDLDGAIAYADAHPVPAGVAAILGLVVLLLIWRTIRIGVCVGYRAVHQHRPEDVLTLVAAVIATTVQAMGMWRFFDVTLHVDVRLRALLAAFIEVAMFTEALRARRNVIESEDHTAGVDGAAVWALAGLSAVLSSLDARSFAETVFRLVVPLVAAWLWERLMAADRRRAKPKRDRRINWRLTPERVLVRLGLAEAADRSASEVDAHRRLTRLARAAFQVRTRAASGTRTRRVRRAERRLDAAMRAAVEHAGLAGDQVRQGALLAQLGALYHARALAEITPDAPWGRPGTGTLELYRVAPNPELQQATAELLAERDGCDAWPDTPKELIEWLDDQPEPGVPESEVRDEVRVPPVLLGLDPHQVQVAFELADEVRTGMRVPGIRAIKKRMRVGQDNAQKVWEYLTAPADG